jgi:phage-related protein
MWFAARRLQAYATIDKGVEEIRIRDDSGIYRVPYRARFADAVFVLHAFEKKMQRTSQRDIAIAKARFSEMMRDRVSRFSLDALVNIAAAIGPRVHMEPV